MRILLGISGGIAAFKSATLLRLFQKSGHLVKVIMTDSAQEFITTKTFEGLTSEQVYTGNWFQNTKGNAHIDLARWADCMVIAPATAHTLYKCAHAKADDLLSNVYLAFDKTVYFAPAMNTQMLQDQSVQTNIQTLKNKGNIVLDPTHGELACGEVGDGKMVEPEDLYRFVLETQSNPSALFNKHIVVTAGPTHEYIDPVRYISCPSTGLMGYSIATEALNRGASVTLISGPSTQTFHGTKTNVVSAQDMLEAVKSTTPCDIFVGAAAVSDYRIQSPQNQKIKKDAQTMTLELVRNPDILSYVSKEKLYRDFVIGFCAETQDVLKHAQQKQISKNLDWIVANEVFKESKGFGVHATSVYMIGNNQQLRYENISKELFAKIFWDEIEKAYETSPNH